MRLTLLTASCLCVLILGCRDEAGPEPAPSKPPSQPEASTPEPEPTPDWQALADASLAARGEAGAIVILDPKEGELLALAERAGRVEHPASVARHPASTIKPLVAMGAMAEGKLEPTRVVKCEGPREIEGGELTCFHDHGQVDFERAMRTSCNHFAYVVADMLTPEQFGAHLRHFGLGTATGLASPKNSAEAPGHIPPAAGIEASIGHGELEATPLQMARAYAALATGRLPARIEAPLPYARGQLERTRHALSTTVEHTEGSGTQARVEGLAIAGKTGTAELEPIEGDPVKYLSWFASWAPVEDPQLVVLVQLESRDTGPDAAALTKPIYQALAKHRE